MTERLKLSNPPITEAVIDIKVRLDENFNPENFSQVYEDIRNEYPNKMPRSQLTVGVDMPTHNISKWGNFVGYWFQSEDKEKIVQFRNDGFSFNKLQPYSSWEEISEEARELWKRYKKITPNLHIWRVGVRYINHIATSRGSGLLELEKYLSEPPSAPRGIQGELSGFLSRISVKTEEQNIFCTVTTTFNLDLDAIILDIDAYKERETGFEDESVQEVLETLREVKNNIFENSLTSSALQSYT